MGSDWGKITDVSNLNDRLDEIDNIFAANSNIVSGDNNREDICENVSDHLLGNNNDDRNEFIIRTLETSSQYRAVDNNNPKICEVGEGGYGTIVRVFHRTDGIGTIAPECCAKFFLKDYNNADTELIMVDYIRQKHFKGAVLVYDVNFDHKYYIMKYIAGDNPNNTLEYKFREKDKDGNLMIDEDGNVKMCKISKSDVSQMLENFRYVFEFLHNLHHAMESDEDPAIYNFVHCDIKRSNICASNKEYKIIDFGSVIAVGANFNESEFIENNVTKSFCPRIHDENQNTKTTVLLPKEDGGFYDLGPCIDVYQMCCTILAILGVNVYEKLYNEAEFANLYALREGKCSINDMSKKLEQLINSEQKSPKCVLDKNQIEGLIRGLSWHDKYQLREIGDPNNENENDKKCLWYWLTQKSEQDKKDKKNRHIAFAAIAAAIAIFVGVFVVMNLFQDSEDIVWHDENFGRMMNRCLIANNAEDNSKEFCNQVKSMIIYDGNIYVSETEINKVDLAKNVDGYFRVDDSYGFENAPGELLLDADLTTVNKIDSFEDIVDNFPLLRILIVFNCALPNNDSSENTGEYSSLESCDLKGVMFYGCNFYNLESLSHASCIMIKDNSDEIKSVKNLDKIPNVEYLLLDGFEELSIDGIKDFKEIKLLNTANSTLDINSLDPYGEAGKSLEYLMLGYLDLTDEEQYNKLTNIINECQYIKKLGIHNSDLTKNFDKIIDLLQEKQLEQFRLDGSNLPSLSELEKIDNNCELVLYDILVNGDLPTLSDFRILYEKKLHYAPQKDELKGLDIYYNMYGSKDSFNLIKTLDGYSTINNIRKNKYRTVIVDNDKIYFFNSPFSEKSGNAQDTLSETSRTLPIINGVDYQNYSFNINTPPDNSINSLDSVLFLFPDIEELYIYNCNIELTNDSSLKYFTKLQKLHISNCKEIDLNIFANENLSNLHYVDIRNMDDIYNSNPDEEVKYIQTLDLSNVNIEIKSLPDLPQLFNLLIKDYPFGALTDEDYLQISKNVSLEWLGIVSYHNPNTFIIDNSKLIDCILQLKNLHNLILGYVLVNLDGFEQLEGTSISYLSLNFNNPDEIDWSPVNWCNDVNGRPEPTDDDAI